MSTRMLLDSAHPEETRVAVVRGNRIEEFDFEAANKASLRGNIYLARVTRVEPSLQAAFVEYGGNRHGFLAFTEIHPDYYQIPVEDRRALLAEQAAHDASRRDEFNDEPRSRSHNDGEDGDDVEHVGADDGYDDAAEVRRSPLQRRYKIQEVIKRRQILLVQVVKEERGTKGAALTTYMSLAGRYCVLMPNTARGGGISRKIPSSTDRKRLKSVLGELDVPEGMGCIIRTAGASRTKAEIKRDYSYLLRLWSTIRDLTLKSIAPALIYEEGSLVKRAIRDMYIGDIDEVLVEGNDGYRDAKEFMKLLMPSHAKKVKQYKDPIPLFHRFQVESQLETMYHATVPLKSGGYLVINPTEALVSIDVNSGKSTRERNIERTAFRTNMEAADEVARQLRLRDLAGLVVIDFIDMEESRNNRAVERRMKDALKTDRARLQVGRISSFGLMEMSRQRLRPGLLESSTVVCPVCAGAGSVRSVESSALQIMRVIEEEGIKGRALTVHLTVPLDVALYILNHKRHDLNAIEERFHINVQISGDSSMHRPHYLLRREGQQDAEHETRVITQDSFMVAEDEEAAEAATDIIEDEAETDEVEATEAEADEVDADEAEARDEEPRREGRGRRRGRGRDRDRPKSEAQPVQAADVDAAADTDDAADTDSDADADTDADAHGDTPADQAADGAEGSDEQRAKRRRGRRGGRRRRKQRADGQADTNDNAESGESGEHQGDWADEDSADTGNEPAEGDAAEHYSTDTPQPEYATMVEESAPAPVDWSEPVVAPAAQSANLQIDDQPEPFVADTLIETAVAQPEAVVAAPVAAAPEPEPVTADAGPAGTAKPPRRQGWWNRG